MHIIMLVIIIMYIGYWTLLFIICACICDNDNL